MRGSRTEMPRTLPRDSQRSETVIWAFALGLAAVFAIGQIITVLITVPAVIAFHQDATLPPVVSLAQSLGPIGIGAALAIVDAVLLIALVLMARRHWIGLVFVAPMLYLGLGSVVLWLLVSEVILRAGG